jgi:hypothetical protein
MSAVVEAIGDVVGGVVEFVGDAVGDIVEFVGDNPLILAAALPFLPGIGAAAGAAGSTAAGAMSVPTAFGAMSSTSALMAPSLTLGGWGAGASALGGLTAAEMLGAQAAADMAMGFTAGEIGLGLEGIGGLTGLGEAGLGLSGGLAEGLSSSLSGVSDTLGSQLSGLSSDALAGINEVGQLGYSTDALAGSGFESMFGGSSAPFQLGAAPSGNYMSSFGNMSFDPSLGGQFDIAGAFNPSDFSGLTSQAPALSADSVISQLPGAGPQPSFMGALGDYASAAIESPGTAMGRTMDFLSKAGQTPVAQGVKTLNNVANLAQLPGQISDRNELLSKQKQVMDAQLEAYRTAGMQSSSGQQPMAPNKAFGYQNYAGQYGIGV